MCDSCTLLHDPFKNRAAKSQIPMRGTKRTAKFKRLLLEGSGEIFDDSCTLLNGAK